MAKSSSWSLAASNVGAVGAVVAFGYVAATPPSALFESGIAGALMGNGMADTSVVLSCLLLILNVALYAPILKHIPSSRIPLLLLCFGCIATFLCFAVADFSQNRYVLSRGLSGYAASSCGLLLAGLLAKIKHPSRWLFGPSLFLSLLTLGLFLTGASSLASGGIQRASGGSHHTLATATCLAFFLVATFGLYAEAKRTAAPRANLLLIPVSINVLALIATLSWAATLAAVVGCAVIGLTLLSRPQAGMTLLACLVSIGVVFVLRTATPEGSLSNQASKAGRLKLATIAWDRCVKALPYGEGLNAAPIEIVNPVTGTRASSEAPTSAPLFLVLQFGIPGVLILGAFVAAFVRAVRSIAWPVRSHLWAIGSALAVLLLLDNVFLTVFAYITELLVFGVLGHVLLAPVPNPSPVAARGSQKARVPAALLSVFLLAGCANPPSTPTPPSSLPTCEASITAGMTRAQSAGKRLFLLFGASWCGDCRALQAFLDKRDVRAILDRYYTFEKIHIFERAKGNLNGEDTPGAEEWLKERGLEASLPTVVVLDGRGNVLLHSARPSKKVNLPPFAGPPTTFTGIETFLRMVSESAPQVTKAELIDLRKIMEKEIENAYR